MNKTTPYVQSERLRSYSSVFTRKVFSDIINYNYFSHLNWSCLTYDQEKKEPWGRFFQSLRLVKAAEPSAGDYFEIIDSLDLWSLS